MCVERSFLFVDNSKVFSQKDQNWIFGLTNFNIFNKI